MPAPLSILPLRRGEFWLALYIWFEMSEFGYKLLLAARDSTDIETWQIIFIAIAMALGAIIDRWKKKSSQKKQQKPGEAKPTVADRRSAGAPSAPSPTVPERTPTRVPDIESEPAPFPLPPPPTRPAPPPRSAEPVTVPTARPTGPPAPVRPPRRRRVPRSTSPPLATEFVREPASASRPSIAPVAGVGGGPPTAPDTQMGTRDRIAELLSNHDSLRAAFVVSELLGQPVGLRTSHLDR